MPLIKIKTSIPSPDRPKVDTLLTTLSAKLAQHLGKPESYVMTAFESDVPMTFGGTLDPACYIEIKSVGGMSATQTKSMSQDFCQAISDELNIPPNRTYIEFAGAEGKMWGWNSGTF
ncbi:phenylpyruvate tautomerase MIF-related protein [Roseofilum capinflatum]|uniref:L-dopachrome isomerase n=1 Tax=Roseofilum capinflatum BLCC-M114 TaxID=3022440 RepID=A0ABT7BBY4_9CYAN|nr:phenylpyruvate tautomerase MIF-related protein [Roseofilum capinflatum]MDJ1176703.1 phenylpyruvate tautomerase MIF-related protein [Roseofilum capinflatum BLCC-M114]